MELDGKNWIPIDGQSSSTGNVSGNNENHIIDITQIQYIDRQIEKAREYYESSFDDWFHAYSKYLPIFYEEFLRQCRSCKLRFTADVPYIVFCRFAWTHSSKYISPYL